MRLFPRHFQYLRHISFQNRNGSRLQQLACIFSAQITAGNPDPTERGIATHLFMQFCDFRRLKDLGVDAEMTRLTEEQFLSPETAALTRPEELEIFRNSRAAETQMEFDLDLAVKQDSENPLYYVQYAHARICSVLRNAAEEGIALPDGAQTDLTVLTHDEEKALIKALALLPEEILEAAARWTTTATSAQRSATLPASA